MVFQGGLEMNLNDRWDPPTILFHIINECWVDKNQPEVSRFSENQ